MNPLAYLLPALYALLDVPPLTWAGASVPAYEHLPGNSQGHYVLLTNPTAVKANGSAACRHWSCTATIDVVTQFPADLISSAPAESLATQVTERIEGTGSAYPRLLLPAGYQCGPASLELHYELPLGVPGLFGVRRLLRYRWEVYYNPGSTAVIGAPRALTSGRLRVIHS